MVYVLFDFVFVADGGGGRFLGIAFASSGMDEGLFTSKICCDVVSMCIVPLIVVAFNAARSSLST